MVMTYQEVQYLLHFFPEGRLPLLKRLEKVARSRITCTSWKHPLRPTAGQGAIDEGWNLLVRECPIAVPTAEHCEGDFRQTVLRPRPDPFHEVCGVVRWFTYTK